MPRVLLVLLAAAGGTFAAPMPAAAQTWTPTRWSGAPRARAWHTAVWTGSKMIVWGGVDETGTSTNTGAVYDPATDSWTATSTTGAPAGRILHVAVWTGSKMIVWGGVNESHSALDTGGVYDPATDSWTATSTVGAPSARREHTAVWTGSKMIVWGGASGYPLHECMSTGGTYDPATDSWMTTSTTGAPAGRVGHVAVWTGSYLIVWGGTNGLPSVLDTGAIYDPATDSWMATTTTTGAPSPRWGVPSVWTGSKMIVWGGVTSGSYDTNTGGVYDLATNSWTATSTLGAPSARRDHTAVWSGSRMIVWGGVLALSGATDTGGVYDPTWDSWTATNTAGAPTARNRHVSLWTGSNMIVWGGADAGGASMSTGAIYSDPAVIPQGSFHTVTPCRVFDTRAASGPTLGAPIACGSERSFAVAGECGVPASAAAVSSNLTGTASTAPGNLRLYPAGSSTPLVSTLNYATGVTRANNAVAALGTDGRISVLCSPSGTTHVILDVNGYFE